MEGLCRTRLKSRMDVFMPRAPQRVSNLPAQAGPAQLPTAVDQLLPCRPPAWLV